MHIPTPRIRELRQARGLPLREIAKEVGRDPSNVHRWETGQIGVPDDAKLKLAAYFDVTVEHLMGWDLVEEETAA